MKYSAGLDLCPSYASFDDRQWKSGTEDGLQTAAISVYRQPLVRRYT